MLINTKDIPECTHIVFTYTFMPLRTNVQDFIFIHSHLFSVCAFKSHATREFLHRVRYFCSQTFLVKIIKKNTLINNMTMNVKRKMRIITLQNECFSLSRNVHTPHTQSKFIAPICSIIQYLSKSNIHIYRYIYKA